MGGLPLADHIAGATWPVHGVQQRARYAWFDFFPPDYEWMGHLNRRGKPDSDYLRNRIARLTFDPKTAEARIEK